MLILESFCFTAIAQNSYGTIDIIAPRRHNPAFISPAGTFTIEIQDTTGISTGAWSVTLKNDIAEWKALVVSSGYARVFNETKDGWRLQVRSPLNISPELMDVEIRHQSGRKGLVPKALSVVHNMEKDFYIFHQSDQHIVGDSAVEPGGKASLQWGHGSVQAMQWLTPFYNLTNPRLVVNTGDNMHLYNVAQDWCGIEEAKNRVERFFKGISGYRVPTITTTGNHDIGYSNYVQVKEWRNIYNKIVGQRVFSYKMGSFYILANEWTTQEFYDWAKNDFEKSFADSTIKYRLVATHFFDGPEGWTTIGNKNKHPDLLIAGHNHRSRILQQTPYPVLTVQSAQNHQAAAFYDFKKKDSGWTSAQPLSHSDSTNVFKLVGDYGKQKVYEVFDKPNNGIARSNTVTITNELPIDFYNGRIKFLMKRKRYKVTGGEVISTYNYGKRKKAVLVQVNIKAHSNTTVSIK